MCDVRSLSLWMYSDLSFGTVLMQYSYMNFHLFVSALYSVSPIFAQALCSLSVCGAVAGVSVLFAVFFLHLVFFSSDCLDVGSLLPFSSCWGFHSVVCSSLPSHFLSPFPSPFQFLCHVRLPLRPSISIDLSSCVSYVFICLPIIPFRSGRSFSGWAFSSLTISWFPGGSHVDP